MAAQLIGDPASPTVSNRSKTSVQDVSTELVFHIVDEVDSFDLHSLNLTSKAFHFAIQQRRWTHARLVRPPQQMSDMIGYLLKMAQDPNSLVDLKRIKSVIIQVRCRLTPSAYSDKFTFELTLSSDESKYRNCNPPELASQLVQLLNLLGNKEQCPQLSHITFDLCGVGTKKIDEFNQLQRTMLNPINVESLRIKGRRGSDDTYSLIGKCVATRLQTLHVPHSLLWNTFEQALSPNHWRNLRKLHFDADRNTYELSEDVKIEAPALEWLSIDGFDCHYDGTYNNTRFLQYRARILAKKFPKLKRLAITWQHDTRGWQGIYREPRDGFLNAARSYFNKNPFLELMTFRYKPPRLIEVERVDGHDLVLKLRDSVKEPREDRWPTICL